MKITDRLAAEALARRVQQGREDVSRLQTEITTGRRVNAPSDDAAAYSTALRTKDAIRRTAVHKSLIDTGGGMLDAASNALSSAHDLMSRARELAISGSTPSATPESRAAAAAELDSIVAGLDKLRRTESNGERVFTAAGHGRRLEVGPGVSGPASVDGDAAFDGGVDLAATVASLAADLRSGDAVTARTRADTLSSGLRQLEGSIATAGASRSMMDLAKNAAEQADFALQNQLQAGIGADTVRAMAELSAKETTLRASLQVGAQLLTPVLANKI